MKFLSLLTLCIFLFTCDQEDDNFHGTKILSLQTQYETGTTLTKYEYGEDGRLVSIEENDPELALTAFFYLPNGDLDYFTRTIERYDIFEKDSVTYDDQGRIHQVTSKRIPFFPGNFDNTTTYEYLSEQPNKVICAVQTYPQQPGYVVTYDYTWSDDYQNIVWYQEYSSTYGFSTQVEMLYDDAPNYQAFLPTGYANTVSRNANNVVETRTVSDYDLPCVNNQLDYRYNLSSYPIKIVSDCYEATFQYE